MLYFYKYCNWNFITSVRRSAIFSKQKLVAYYFVFNMPKYFLNKYKIAIFRQNLPRRTIEISREKRTEI